MPCRLRGVRRPLQRLLITDEIQVDSSQRLVRISKAHRRNGSNSPGPLESYRRLARRRMGAVVNPGGADAPFAELGSLFTWDKWFGGIVNVRAVQEIWQPTQGRLGLMVATGDRPQHFVEDFVQYQEPSRRIPFAADAMAVTAAQTDALETNVSRDETAKISDGSSAGQLNLRKVFVDERIGELEKVMASQGFLTEDSWPRLRYLHRRPQNDAFAHETIHLLQWLSSQSSSAELVSYAISGVVHEVKRRILAQSITESDLGSILLACTMNDHLATVTTQIATFLARKWPRSCKSVVVNVTTALLSIADREQCRQSIDNWLHQLDLNASRSLNEPAGLLRVEVYAHIAPRFLPSELPKHFVPMREDILVDTIVHQWVVRGLIDPTQLQTLSEKMLAQDSDIDTASLYRRGFKILSSRTLSRELVQWPSGNTIMTHLGKIRLRWSWNSDTPKWRRHRMLDLVSTLAHRGLPYTRLLLELFALKRQRGNIALVETMFNDLCLRLDIGIPVQLAADLVQFALDEGRFDVAWNVFQSLPTLPLMRCLDLPIHMIEQGKAKPRHLQHVLARRTNDDVVPPLFRTDGRRAVPDAIADLAAIMAFKLAHSPTITARTAARRVEDVFRYLRSRQLLPYRRDSPRAQLMARAYMKAGVLRCFEEKRPLSRTMTGWVLARISALEGSHDLEAMDEAIYDAHQTYRRSSYYTLSLQENKAPIARKTGQEQFVRFRSPALHKNNPGTRKWRTMYEMKHRKAVYRPLSEEVAISATPSSERRCLLPEEEEAMTI